MTLIGHAALGFGVFGAARTRRGALWGMTRRTLLACCLLLPMLPDADVVMHTWVKYGHPLGHRGFTHSLLFALVVGVLVAWSLARLGKLTRSRSAVLKASALFVTLLASHALTDAMTTGGKAPLLLWPITTEGQWAPSRVIPVSPMGKSLLRTEWSSKQLASAERRRRKLLQSDAKTHWLVRRVVGLSARPDHARRLQVLGVALTELLYLSPLALIAALLAVWRRRYGAPHDPDTDEARERGPPSATPTSTWMISARWLTRWWRVAAYLTGACALALTAALIYTRTLDAGLELEHGTLPDRLRTPYVRVAPDDARPDAPLAILVHGWRCSHQMMLPMARMLARNGVEAYAIDLPGHASSPIPLDTSCPDGRARPCRANLGVMFTDRLADVLAGMQHAGVLAGRELVLIGHSSGGIAAANLELTKIERPSARVVLEGAVRSIRPGRNLLFVGRARKLAKYPNLPVDRTAGSPEDGTAWRGATINIPHLRFVRDEATNKEVLDWIAGATGATLREDTRHHFNTYVAVSFMAALAGALAWFSLLAAARRRGWLPAPASSTTPRGWTALLCVIFGGLAAALWAGELFRSGDGWQMARLRQTALIYLALASVTVAGPYAAITWRPRDLRPLLLLRDVVVGLAAAALVFGSFAVVANAYYFHALFAPWRLPSVLLWGFALLPITLVAREAGPRRAGALSGLLALVARVSVWGALLAIHALGRSSSGASEVMSLLVIIAVAELLSSATERLVGGRLAPAVTVAIGVAWTLVTAYPALISSTS